MSNKNKLTTLALTLLITGSIDSIRNLPATALFGSQLIFFFIFAAAFFLIPTALISAELAANINESGIYKWVRLALGEKIGFLAIWLQWINVVVWFPTILSFITGTAVYFISPELAHNPYYLAISTLSVFWLITVINLKGIHLSSKVASFCTIAGLIIPMSLIIASLFTWIWQGNPIQIHFNTSNVLPDFKHIDSWMALTAIILGLAGMELAAVHIHDVNNPKTAFPRALAYSTMIILITMILGSLAIAFVLPQDKISLINGTMQTFEYFLNAYHISWLTPILTLLLVTGSLGGIINWVVSPIKGMAQAAEHGYLPPVLAKKNKHGVAQNLLLLQSALVSIFCLAFLLFPGVNGSYWLLTALSTQLYMLMYVLMFIAALSLRFKFNYSETATFTLPGKKVGTVLICLMGLIGCAITIMVGFIPPVDFNIGSAYYYEIIFCSGLIGLLLPTAFFYWYKERASSYVELIEDDEGVIQEPSASI